MNGPNFYDLGRALDSHSIYAAFFNFDDNVIVKVGRSTKPYARVISVASGCPFALSAAVFSHVGPLQKAMSIEATVMHQLAAYRTRGEWYRFKKSEGENFSRHIRLAYGKATGRVLKWTALDVERMKQEMLESFKTFRGGRGRIAA